MNRRDRGYRADDRGRITEFKETNGQRQGKCQYTRRFVQDRMDKNKPFIFFKPIHNIEKLDCRDKHNPYTKPSLNMQDRNQLYQANRDEHKIRN